MKIRGWTAFRAIAILAAGALYGDTISTWNGGTSANYSTPSNWSNGVANGAFSATIPGGTTFEPIATGNNTVDNLTLSTAGSALTIGNNSSLFVNASGGGAISNNGTLAIASSGFVSSLVLEGTGPVTLGGAGTLTLNDPNHVWIYANNSGTSLINNSTIQGAGQLITSKNVGSAYGLTNNGTISATGGLLISTLGGTTNTGTLQAASGGTLTLLNDTFTQTGSGVILAKNGGLVNLEAATLSGGTLTTQGTGSITTFSNTTSTLSGDLTISNGSTVTVADEGAFNLTPGTSITNNGILALNSGANLSQLVLNGAGTVTLNGTGTYLMGNQTGNRIIALAAGATLVNNSTIQGSGSLLNKVSVGDPFAVVNNGTITSSGSTGLIIANGGGLTNTGIIQSSAGSNLTIQNETVAQTGGGTIVAAANTLVNLAQATVTGGTLTSGASAAFTTVGNNTLTLGNGTTLSSGSNLIVANEGTLFLQAGTTLTNNGQISLDSSGSVSQLILTSGASGPGIVTLSGTGSLVATCTVPGTNCANVAPDNKITANVNGMTLVNDVNHTIGAGVNLVAGSSGDPFNFQNNGNILISANHSFAIAAGTTLDNYSGNTLTGGSYDDSGVIQFNNANIVNNAAGIILRGAGQIVDQNNHNALAGFADNLAGGSFSILSGSNLAVSGAFQNLGLLTVGSDDIFATGAGLAYTQAGGITQVDGTLTAVGGVMVTGGVLKGSGTIDGAVSVGSGGSVDPGDSPGTLSIDGDFSMASDGSFGVLFDGSSSGQYDVLDVSGTTALGGTLNLTTGADFTPVAGEQFDVMNFASHTGTFDDITGVDLGGGYIFEVSYNSTDVVVMVEGPESSTPEPRTELLLGLGLVVVASLRKVRGRL